MTTKTDVFCYPKGTVLYCFLCTLDILRVKRDVYEQDIICHENSEPIGDYSPAFGDAIVCPSCGHDGENMRVKLPEGWMG